jgi:nucleoside-diphosphate-sugar epimerase
MSTRRNSNERYLVIGGAGFLGSYIVQALVDRGEVGVAVFGGAKPIDNEVIGGVSYFPGDITNRKELRDCLEKVSLQLCCLPHVFISHTVSVDLANGCLPYCLSERQE